MPDIQNLNKFINHALCYFRKAAIVVCVFLTLVFQVNANSVNSNTYYTADAKQFSEPIEVKITTVNLNKKSYTIVEVFTLRNDLEFIDVVYVWNKVVQPTKKEQQIVIAQTFFINANISETFTKEGRETYSNLFVFNNNQSNRNYLLLQIINLKEGLFYNDNIAVT